MSYPQAHADLIARYSDTELETIADFLTRFTDNVKAQTAVIEGVRAPRAREHRRQDA